MLASAAAVLSAAVALSSCGSGADAGTRAAAPSAVPTPSRPAGPAADLSTELSGGDGPFLGLPNQADMTGHHFVEHEYAAAGTATDYKAQGALTHDGRWTFTPDGTAPYRTRVLVRRPASARAFSGTVVVEWLNVSGGLDVDPDWASTQEEILRRGDIWVGVSAQRIGVTGGDVAVGGGPGSDGAGKGLTGIDSARYGSLTHPGDGFSFDMFTQIARAVRAGAGLGGARPARLIAAGESQSAFAMVTYYNGVQPLTHAFDGFLIHSRGASGLPLAAPGTAAGIADALAAAVPTALRTDQSARVLDIQTESDLVGLLNSSVSRQPDSDRFRLWEVAGTAHADAHLLGPAAAQTDCGAPINDGPMHIVAKAALRSLTTWISTGQAPPTAPRIELTAGDSPQIRRDADAIALGGVRTPPVNVAVDVLSGVPGPHPSTYCLLLGSTRPLPAQRIAELHPNRAAYVARYNADLARTIAAGFALADDRAALAAYAKPDRIPA
ncbi:alpha/beta hydrolase domain-containing protein [Frankia canadensis]|uniref:alpha/beta hydrolase domain-containing protein n=1 Tax=Frankia canadensis TaxID=1836972 RepID=UPI000C7A1B22|nr:alpha/beta hydrolase domain-containing protein [Frankia canadensis]